MRARASRAKSFVPIPIIARIDAGYQDQLDAVLLPDMKALGLDPRSRQEF
jgi:hypothetical protein